MPSPTPRFNRTGTERSMSFNGRAAAAAVEELRRPRTVPDLWAAAGVGNGGGGSAMVTAVKATAGKASASGKLTKVLINVTVQGSVGAVQVLVSPESTVRELIMGVVKQYVKEGRRPVVFLKDVDEFDLHYSQFSLESLDREEKLAVLGSRNFFMCKRRMVAAAADGGDKGAVAMSFCSKEAEKATKLGSPCPWFKFMSFLF